MKQKLIYEILLLWKIFLFNINPNVEINFNTVLSIRQGITDDKQGKLIVPSNSGCGLNFHKALQLVTMNENKMMVWVLGQYSLSKNVIQGSFSVHTTLLFSDEKCFLCKQIVYVCPL